MNNIEVPDYVINIIIFLKNNKNQLINVTRLISEFIVDDKDFYKFIWDLTCNYSDIFYVDTDNKRLDLKLTDDFYKIILRQEKLKRIC